MAIIDDQIAALEEAVAMGARKVIFHSGGTRREIEYQSLESLQQALARLKSNKSGGSRIILAALD